MSLIIESLLDSQLIVVHQETTVGGMWEALAKWHLNKGLMNILYLTRRFLTNHMSFSETMEQHINKLNMMVKKLEAIETKVPLKVTVMVFLLSLLDSYKFVVTSLEFYESMKLTWEVVTTRLLIDELMRKERGDAPSTSDVALIHKSQNNVGFKKTTRDKSQDVCNYCKMKGHWVRDCTKRKKDENLKNLRKRLMQKKKNMEIVLPIIVKRLSLQHC